MSVEDHIINILAASGSKMSMTELVTKVQEEAASVKPAAVKAAVLPLISTDRVDFTSDRKLRIHGSDAA